MKLTSAVYSLLLILLLPSLGSAQDFHRIEQSIIGGRPAQLSELYSTIAILAEDPESGELMASCTGTLIAPRVVLTAAHCVVEQDPDTDELLGELSPESLWVVVGSLTPEYAEDERFYEIEYLVPHPDYPGEPSDDPSGLGRENDVAVLVLYDEVEGMSPAPIVRISELAALTPQSSLVITGYGLIDVDSEESGELYIANTTFVRRNDTELLAGDVDVPDTCMGDSGGPAYLLGSNGYALLGVTSRGRSDSDLACGEGGLYTIAAAYLPWYEQASSGAFDASIDYGNGTLPPPSQPRSDDDDGCSLSRSLYAPTSPLPLAVLALIAFGLTLLRRQRGL